MKLNKKVVSAAAVLLLGAVAVTGTSLAYFTADDSATNTFTTGNVDVELVENFEQDSKLLPTTGKDEETGLMKNGVTKEVTVKNTGSEDAFVRIHIAIPTVLHEDGEELLKFNYPADSKDASKWDWDHAVTYNTTVDGVNYTVYVVTYGTALTANQETPEKAINEVYMVSTATNADVTAVKEALGDKWNILVSAEAAQAAGFDSADEALNTAFGNPGTYEAFK